MYRCLVTGGAGFVGRHLIKRLLDQNNTVYCVDNFAVGTGARHYRDWFFDPIKYGNKFGIYLQDIREFCKTVTNLNFDYIFHLAAMVGGRLMLENDPLAIAQDLSIDAEIFPYSKKHAGKLVYFSSSAAYPVSLQGVGSFHSLKESDQDLDSMQMGVPDLTYGWAKLTGEFLAKQAYEKVKLNSVCYRPFSGYGFDQDLTYPFPSLIKKVIDAKDTDKTVEVWGNGDQIRDFIHIEDCITGVLSTMNLVDNAMAINLSTGIGTSFINLITKMANLYGYAPRIKLLSDKPSGVSYRVGSVELQHHLGFEAKITLEEGIKEALEKA